jgi:type I restriction enzyme S subunit
VEEMMFYRETDFKDEQLIGEIPKNWESIKLEEVVEIHDSKRIPLSEMERKNRKGQYPYCGANGIIDYIDNYIFDGEFVLLAEDGGSYGRLENTAYIMNGKFWVNNHAHILRAIEGKTSNLFLKYALDFLDLNPYVVGSTRKKLNQEQMREIRIPLPPFEEQRGIVGVLGVVDSVIAKTGEVIAKTERLKKGLMQTLLTRGIGHKEYKQTPIGTIPKEWEVCSLEEICTAIIDCPHTTPKFTDKGVLVVRNFNIREGELILEPAYYTTEEEWRIRTRRCIPENGDVLFSREAPIGEACLAPTNTRFSLGQRTMLLRPDKKLLNPLFLVYVFYSPLIRRKLRNLEAGVTAHHVNVADIKKLKIPVPTVSEQERIASTVSAIAEKLRLERNEKARLEKVKRGLMDLLLTGKIRVKVD